MIEHPTCHGYVYVAEPFLVPVTRCSDNCWLPYAVQQRAGGGLRLPGASAWGMMVVVRVSRQT